MQPPWDVGLARRGRGGSAGGVAEAPVREEMGPDVLELDPEDTLREAARRMVERRVDAALVDDGDDRSGPGIFTARDLLEAIGAGGAPQEELVAMHYTPDATSVTPDSSLGQAAEVMAAGGFRHLPVVDDGETVGVISIRDIVRRLTEARATPGADFPIEGAMRTAIPLVPREESLRHAARMMLEQASGAAIVEAPTWRSPPDLVTERELRYAVGAGQDPGAERVADHVAERKTFAAPTWSLKQAAEAMASGGFEHVVVVDGQKIRGAISMRGIVRAWMGAARE